MAIVRKTRVGEAATNVGTNVIFAAIALIVVAIVGIWFKEVWSTPTALYIVCYVLVTATGVAALLGPLAVVNKNLGLAGFIISSLAGLLCFVFGIVTVINGSNIYLIFIGSSALILIQGYHSISSTEKGYENVAVHELVPPVLHIIVISIFAGIGNVPFYIILILPCLEAIVAVYKIIKKAVDEKAFPFSYGLSAEVDAEEETEDEKALKKQIREINKETRRKNRQILIDAFVEGSKERKAKHKARAAHSGKYDDYTGKDWCDLIENKLDHGCFIYAWCFIETEDWTESFGRIEIHVELDQSGETDDKFQNGIDMLYSNLNSLQKKCPYQLVMDVSLR